MSARLGRRGGRNRSAALDILKCSVGLRGPRNSCTLGIYPSIVVQLTTAAIRLFGC